MARNIIVGSYLGGNAYPNHNGTDFSQKCMDMNIDGICDTNYSLNSANFDYLPLALPGYINGTVLENGTGIAGATVMANTSVAVTTNESGFYSLPVPMGT